MYYESLSRDTSSVCWSTISRARRSRTYRRSFFSLRDMIRGRGFTRGGAFVDFLLVVVLITLGYVFVVRRSYMGTVNAVVSGDKLPGDLAMAEHREAMKGASDSPGEPGGGVDDETQHLIDARVKKVPDTRPRECRDMDYGVKDRVSIVVDFFDYQYYDLKTTMSSILQNTPKELIHEIIVVDDGSTLDYIIKDVKEFVAGFYRSKLVHNKVREGQSKARVLGLAHALADVVVFVDPTVICNQGWLEPLIAVAKRERHVLVVPHYDSVQDPVSYQYQSTSDKLVATFSWSLAVRMTESEEPLAVTGTLPTNVMRGNAFLAYKDFLKHIGGLDSALEEMGGEALELSLRAWMCGGAVRVVPCSRIGIQNLHDPVKIASARNIRHIAELWLSERKDLVYKYTGAGAEMSEAENQAVGQRKTMLQGLQCKGMKWYMEQVAKDVPTPSIKAVHYGMLRCKTGRCARVGSDNRLDLGSCSHLKYSVMKTDLLFELDAEGYLKSKGLCLTTKDTAYIMAEHCRENDGQQKWTFADDGALRNVWSGFCAMHVTDPDKKTGGTRQIAMAQDCKDATGDFVSWEFGSV